MASQNCSVCELQQQECAPTVWCPLCEECLCLSCSKQHEVQTATRNHTTISYDDYRKLPPFILNIKLICEKHQEKYQYYCKSCDCPICRKCLFESHKKCEDTLDINDAVHNIKTSVVFEDKWRDLEAVRQIFLKAVQDKEENMNEFKRKREDIASNVKEYIGRLIDQLKKFENETLFELDSVTSKYFNEFKDTIKILEIKEQNLAEILEQKELIEKHASNFQTFIGTRQMEQEVKDSKDTLKQLSDIGAMNHTDIQIEEQEDIVFGMKPFGKIKTSTEKKTISFDKDKPITTQKLVQNPKHLILKQEFKLSKGEYLGCCTMSNGIMVFADWDNQVVKIVKPDGSLKSFVKLEKYVTNITPIKYKHVAVSVVSLDSISIIDINSSRVIKTLKTENNVSGLTHHHGNIVFCVPGKGIMLTNIDSGKIDKAYDDKSVGGRSHIDTDGNRICYTCYIESSVTVLDSDYKVFLVIKNENLSGPISMDQHQNMFALSDNKDEIFFISKDGDKCIVILPTKDDGLHCPKAVHYDRESKEIMVVDRYSAVRKYNVI